MPADSVGCETPHVAAARPKWRSRASAERYLSCRRSMRAGPRRGRSNDRSHLSKSLHCRLRSAPGRGILTKAPINAMSANLVELIRRHHAVGRPDGARAAEGGGRAPRRAHRRRPSAPRPQRSGLPEATVHGVATFYDDLLAPRGRAPRARLHRHRLLRGDRRRARRRDRARASGSRLGERSGGRRGLARRDRLPRLLPQLAGGARRRRDRRRPRRRRARARGRRRATRPSRPRAASSPSRC